MTRLLKLFSIVRRSSAPSSTRRALCSSSTSSSDDAVERASAAAPVSRRPTRRLLVGLGNVGAEYVNTRHNIGFAVLDRLAAQYLPVLTRSPPRNIGSSSGGAGAASSPRSPPATWATRDALKGDVLDAVLHFQAQPVDLIDAFSERRRKRTLDEGVPYPTVETRLLKVSNCIFHLIL